MTTSNRADLKAELRAPMLVLLFVVPLLAIAGWRVEAAVADAGSYQHDIRIAQIARARCLRFQLDEETGLRGYLATNEKLYLEPYTTAAAALPAAFAHLKESLGPLSLGDVQEVAHSEQRINAAWIASIVRPLLAHPGRSAASLELQRRGKYLVDQFRNDDQQLLIILDGAAAAADQRSGRAIANTLFYVIGAVIALTLAAGFLGFQQAQASRSAFENRVLYENQKRIADLLQTAFLNNGLPMSPHVGLHATYVPATTEEKVGGDWYDAFELPDKRILFSIGDVAGHGIEAAVVMSRARQAIVAAALHEDDPAKVLERANASIILQSAHMVTAICGYIDTKTLEVVYATAGHPPPVLARPDHASQFLPHAGIPLGIMQGATYRTFVARVFDGAMIVLYTDGVTEHKRNLLQGEARLLEAARLAVLEENPALAIRNHIFASAAPIDDVAILTLSFKDLRVQPTSLPRSTVCS